MAVPPGAGGARWPLIIDSIDGYCCSGSVIRINSGSSRSARNEKPSARASSSMRAFSRKVMPVMVDSSRWEVIEAGLRCLQGKGIVNSVSMKEGEEKFIAQAKRVRRYGAALIVMAFDERGQADTYERKIEVCARSYKILTEQVGFPPQDIIFDPNILTVGTGIEEHNSYAVNFIEATRWIKKNLPLAKVSQRGHRRSA